MIIYFGITGCFLPYAFWIAQRVFLSSKRMERRVKEQAEFAAAMHATSGSGHHSKPSHVITSPVNAATSSGSSDLDELSSVKQEIMVTILLGGVIGMPLVFIETAWTNEWVSLHFWCVALICLTVTGIEPVVTSFRVAAKQREMFRKARSAGGANVGGRSKFVAQIAHHRPLYRLRHLLHVDSFAYSLLLKFLQREYSSENALFCREARAFGQYCKELEASLPGWRSTVDEDDDTSGGHLLSSITSAPGGARRGVQSMAVSQYAAPNVLRNNMMQASPAAPTATPSKRIMHRTGASVAPAPAPTPVPATSSDAPCSADLTADGAHPATVTGSLQSSVVLASGGRGSGITASSHADGRRLLRASYESSIATIVLPSPARSPAPARSPPRSAKSSRAGAPASGSVAMESLRSAAPAVAPAQTMSFRVMHQRVAKARDWALKIHADYLQPNAVYQINIDSDLSRLVAGQIAQLRLWQPTPLDSAGEPDFDRAAMESAPPLPPPFPLSSLYKQTALSVFNLMETDSFRRFLLTQDFQLLLQRADDEEMARLQHATAAAADTAMMLARADAALAQSPAASAPTTPAPASSPLATGDSPRLQIVSVHSGARHAAGARSTDGAAAGGVLQHVRHVEQLQPARASISANHSTVANAAAVEPPSPLPAEPISPLP